MTKLFSRWLPCVTLATWSAVLFTFHFTGRIQSFLTPEFRAHILPAAIALGVMALIFAAFPADAECCSSNDCGHPLSRFGAGKWLTFLILLLPITTAAFTSKDGFGKTAMLNRGVITDAASLPAAAKAAAPKPLDLPLPSNNPAPANAAAAAPAGTQPAPATAGSAAPASNEPAPSDYLQRTPEGYIVAEVLDLLYAAQDNTLRKDFEGKTVQLIGQLMPDTSNNAKGNRFKAVRMFMTCCAADARPVATLVEAGETPSVPEMTWIKITGVSTFPIENGRRTAVLKAERVEKTDPPAETMLY